MVPRAFLVLWSALLYAFLLAPIAVIVIFAFSDAVSFAFPPGS